MDLADRQGEMRISTRPELHWICVLAGLDLNPERQKALLRSACFGAAFCPHPAVTDDATPTPSSPSLHAMCCKLRVLNALREARPGMPLTLAQLEALTLPGVVARYE